MPGQTKLTKQSTSGSEILALTGQLQLAQGTGGGASALGFQQVHLGDF
jgi:hypothetical protein